MFVTRLDPTTYRRTPWKNGGGMTVDIADAYRADAVPGDWSAMLWRPGRTEIVAAGPFSDLSGYDRILTVIGGRGLTLRIEGGAALDVREPFRPVRFRGEDRITSQLEAGPVAVLNLIADRRHAIDVAVLGGGEGRPLGAAINIIYAPAESTVVLGAERYRLAADAALRLDGPGELRVESGRVILATISSRSAP
ncbi:MAG: HutD family protein [Alphaproteobacteria bacterium]|nr:HutD family protein [Alphaproteobacteria bacterium]